MTHQPLPDFLIIGAMKSGTSTLQAQLAAQPGIFMTTPKEPNFFSDDDVYARGLGWYGSLFEAAAPGDLKGEASTHYTKLPTYPETVVRLFEVLDAPKLIYVIRDPIERALSQYLHEWSHGSVSRDAAAAFASCPEFVQYSRYPDQLAPFLERFGKASLLLTSLEALKEAPQRELDRIARHLNPDLPMIWDTDMKAQNVSRERVRTLPFQKILIDNPVATAIRRSLVPKRLRTLIRKARQRDDRPRLPDALRQTLEQTFAPDQETLTAMFPEFDALPLSYPFAPAPANTLDSQQQID